MAGFIPQDIIEQVLNQTDIVTLVEQYIKLNKKSSSNYFGLCPFHSETKPSFSVSPNKQIFYCFSCRRGGNAIKFIQDVENLNFPESVRFLAERANIKLPAFEYSEKYEKQQEERKIQQNLHLEAARFYYKNLQSKTGKAAIQYMKNRGYSDYTMKRFGIGLADEGWDSLAKYLKQKGFSDQAMLDSGLIRRSSKGNLIDLFRNRVMIPIFPSHGEYIIGFGGRTLSNGDEPKYINSPETLLYNKSENLFAMNLVRKLRPLPDTIMVAEGYMDVIALHQAGYTNSVASLGTALTEKQAGLIDRYAKTVVLCYDSDRAGVEAALRAIQIFDKYNVDIKVLDFKDAKDPDNYIHMYGKERFDALLKEAPNAIDFQIKIAKQDSIDENGKLNINLYSDKVCHILSGLSSGIMIEVYAKRLADEINVSDRTILYDIEKIKQKPNDNKPVDTREKYVSQTNQNFVEQQAVSVIKENPQYLRYELISLVLISTNRELYLSVENLFNEKLFYTKGLRKIFQLISREIANNTMSIQKLIDWFEQEVPELSSNLMKTIFSLEDDSITIDKSVFIEIQKKLESFAKQYREKDILDKLHDKTLTNEEKTSLIKELSQLQKLH